MVKKRYYKNENLGLAWDWIGDVPGYSTLHYSEVQLNLSFYQKA